MESGLCQRGVSPVSSQIARGRHLLVPVRVGKVGRSSKRRVRPRSGRRQGLRHPVPLQDGHGPVDPGEQQVPMDDEESNPLGSSFHRERHESQTLQHLPPSGTRRVRTEQRRGGALHTREISQGGHRKTLGEDHGVDSHGHVAKWTTRVRLGLQPEKRVSRRQSSPSHGFDSGPEQRGRNLLRDRRRCLEAELFLQLALHQRGRGLRRSVWHDARHPLRVFERRVESSDGASRHGFVAGSALPDQRRAQLLRSADNSISTREERRDQHCGSASGRERWHLGSVRAGRSDATHLASEI